jgi:SAM-dependent methyltransferase
MSDSISSHYDKAYFDWQAPIGEFGGWAEQTKFINYISSEDTVLDFGCGGGFLLKHLNCKKKVGIEVNPSAAETARKNGIEVFERVSEVQDQSIDVIISNHALEHALRPLDELKYLFDKLKPNGKIIVVVPCESIAQIYKPSDINNHLYTWSPMNLGNLFTEAGFSVLESKPYVHKWPPKYQIVAKIGGRPLFEIVGRLWAQIDRTSFQVRTIGEKKA